MITSVIHCGPYSRKLSLLPKWFFWVLRAMPEVLREGFFGRVGRARTPTPCSIPALQCLCYFIPFSGLPAKHYKALPWACISQPLVNNPHLISHKFPTYQLPTEYTHINSLFALVYKFQPLQEPGTLISATSAQWLWAPPPWTTEGTCHEAGRARAFVKHVSGVFLLSSITVLHCLLFDSWKELPHVACPVICFLTVV